MIENRPFFISPPYRAADQLHAFRQVEGDEVLRVQPLLLPVRVGAFGAVHHHEVRLKVRQFGVARADKHVFHEVRLPCHLGDEAHFQARVGVGAAERVHHEQTLAGELVAHQGFQMLPDFRGERLVVVLAGAVVRPPDGIARGVVAHDVFVLRRTAGEFTGRDVDRAQLGEGAAFQRRQVGAGLFGEQ